MRGFKIPSRNKKVVDENPIETVCPMCKHKQHVIEDIVDENGTVIKQGNTEKLFKNSRMHWCENCQEPYVTGMRCFDYKYS